MQTPGSIPDRSQSKPCPLLDSLHLPVFLSLGLLPDLSVLLLSQPRVTGAEFHTPTPGGCAAVLVRAHECPL